MEPGEGDDPETVFAELIWTENQGQDFPIDLSASFKVEDEFPKPFWIDADLLSEDSFATSEIRSTLNELHHCLSNGNMNDFQNLFQVKTKAMGDGTLNCKSFL